MCARIATAPSFRDFTIRSTQRNHGACLLSPKGLNRSPNKSRPLGAAFIFGFGDVDQAAKAMPVRLRR
jgi:hypothetical protein